MLKCINMSHTWCWAFFLFLCPFTMGKNQKCISRNYGYGGTVCVCNATYCDTIEPLKPFANNEYNVYISSQSGLRFQFTKSNFQSQSVINVHQIHTNPRTTHQKIYGFGAAFTDSACLNIKTLSPEAQQKLLESYFSSHGIEYNFGRVPIGGTDFSTHPYTLDSVENDTTLEHFQLTSEDVNLKIPLIHASLKLSSRPVYLMAAAWSPPPWMKTNNRINGFGVLKGLFYGIWARYHIRFLEEYKKYGLNFWALSTGNEPTAGLLPYYPFNNLGWTPFSQSAWISKHLGPQLQNSPFNQTLIMAIDGQRYTLPWWPKILYSNPKTRAYVAGIGLHWYYDFLPSQLQDWTYSEFPDKFLLSTEACVTKEKGKPAVLLGSWERGEKYASNIISNINHFVGGWLDWNLALDLKGGPNWVNNVVDASIIINTTAGEFYKQPMYYALGHFSKFVPENSVRIELKRSSSFNLDTVAFLTPENNIVVVLLNKRRKPILVTIHGSQGDAPINMPEKSMATLIYKNI